MTLILIFNAHIACGNELAHYRISNINTLNWGEPLRAPFGCARVGLSAPSPSPRFACLGGSATIPLASRTVAPEVRLGARRFAAKYEI
jgi:hypothetical protein